MDVKKVLTRMMESKKKITVVCDCYSDSAVVIAVSDDAVTVCDNPEFINYRERASEGANISCEMAACSFRIGDIKSGLRRGMLAAEYHADAAEAVSNMSIRTIQFNDLIGFTV